METDRTKHSNLYLDRDGKPLPTAELSRNYHQHYLSLPIQEKENALQDSNGMVTAKIQVFNAHTPEQVMSDDNHPVQHAIDASLETYWAQAVVTKEPIYSSMKKQ
jgi:hypothetical protein